MVRVFAAGNAVGRAPVWSVQAGPGHVIVRAPAAFFRSAMQSTEAPPLARRSGPLIWVMHSTGLGANRQLLNLAHALGGTFEVKNTLDSILAAFIARLTGAAKRPIPARKRDRLRPPWPDLVLFGGGRSLVDALQVRAASGGHSRIVCIGRTGAPLDAVDLVLTTPQYGLPEHPRVVHLDLPLNFVDPERLRAAREAWRERFVHLPRPWTGVLLGGDSGSYYFTRSTARRLGRALRELVHRNGGALLITTSPRSRSEIVDAVASELEAPNFCYRFEPADPDNPLDAILGLADRFVVTADSASMLAEACSTGRPVASFEPELRWRARLLSRSWLPSRPRGLRPAWESIRDRWTAAGRWIPARRMERIHRHLEAAGRIATIENLEQHTVDDNPARQELARAVDAVRALLGIR